jgi:hypothetical protein
MLTSLREAEQYTGDPERRVAVILSIMLQVQAVPMLLLSIASYYLSNNTYTDSMYIHNSISSID